MTLIALCGCTQPFDLSLNHVNMPGADDANHPAAQADPAMAENTDPGSVHSLVMKVMTFPEGDGR